MKLKDKIAIVTGAGQGLGRAIALMLGEEGGRQNDLQAGVRGSGDRSSRRPCLAHHC